MELGGGSGNLKELLPETLSTDIMIAPWLDAVLDAQTLPFKDESLENIVLFDVLHHLSEPALFFSEAVRILKERGRIILMEPYVSRASFFVYRYLHAEGMDRAVDPLGGAFPRKGKDPFQGNQAVPSLIFGKCRKEFTRTFPELKIAREEWTDFFVYPLSGGFHQPSLCPLFLIGPLERFERLLRPLRRYLAFRMFVVLERR